MADAIEDMPSQALTDQIAQTLAESEMKDHLKKRHYRTAIFVVKNISDANLIAELRRRGYGVLGESKKRKCTGNPCPDDCEPCGSGDLERMCDDCIAYAKQDGHVEGDDA